MFAPDFFILWNPHNFDNSWTMYKNTQNICIMAWENVCETLILIWLVLSYTKCFLLLSEYFSEYLYKYYVGRESSDFPATNC